MSVATDSSRASFGLLIDGEDVHPAKTFPVPDPITQKTIHYAPAGLREDATRAVEAAETAFELWRDSTPLERRTIMLKAAEIIRSRRDELAGSMMRETGAKASWAKFNIDSTIELVHECAGMVTQIKGEVLPSNGKGTLVMNFKEPCGVVLGIAPWNAPIILGVRAFAVPLICGNSIVLKGSESSPHTQYLIADCFRKAGLPKGVLNFICCTRESAAEVTEAMVSHPAVRRVNFTGSTAVGRSIAVCCAKYLKPVMLELGGKAPMVLLQDADLEEAVKAAAFGAMQHQGQICMSTERIIVHKSISAKFAELFAAKINSMRAENPAVDDTAALGSLISPVAGGRVEKLVTDAVSKGANIRAGTASFNGAIAQPVVLEGISKDMDLYYTESFGPVTTIFEFETTEEAIRLANDTEYGLVCSVFSKDVAAALAVGRKINSGSCHINGATIYDESHLPLGGQKASGFGRFNGMQCVNEFTEDRIVTIKTAGQHYPI